MSETATNIDPIYVDRARALDDPLDAQEIICSEAGALILIDKPYGETSFHVVARIRSAVARLTGIRRVKVGHAGTLDPLATGLLIIGTRRSTKLLDSVLGEDKTYLLTLRLGLTSPSFDLETPISVITNDFSKLSKIVLEESLPQFRGLISQTPPIHSAIKQQGKPVYERARKGLVVEMVSRNVTVYDLEIVSFELPTVILRVRCSKGTYIRSLVSDIGATLGTGAVLTALVRESIGASSLQDALTLEEIVSVLGFQRTVELPLVTKSALAA